MKESGISPRAVFRRARTPSGESAVEWLPPDAAEDPERLRIHVLFTTTRETLAALKRATQLSMDLDAKILLIVPQIVPFPLDLDNPPVPLDFASHQVRRLAESVDADFDGHIYLCRDRLQTFLHVLRAHSVAILGLQRRWFFGKSERLARALRRNGHQVILARTA